MRVFDVIRPEKIFSIIYLPNNMPAFI